MMKRNCFLITAVFCILIVSLQGKAQDIIKKKHYTLTVESNEATFDPALKQRLVETFFKVYPKLVQSKIQLVCHCSSLIPAPSLVKTYKNPLPVSFGDPFVLFVKGDKYYMYGTDGAKNGFAAYSSADLVNWKKEGQVYFANNKNGWSDSTAGWNGAYWAPEVYEVKGKFYMFYSAQWKVNPTKEFENFRIGVAVADKLPFLLNKTLGSIIGYPGSKIGLLIRSVVLILFPLCLQTCCEE